MAYARDDGKDPIKKWKPFDFDVKNLTLKNTELLLKNLKEIQSSSSDWPNRRIQYRRNWI